MAETQAPKFIYLQDGGNLEPLRADQYDDQVTWCEVSVEDDDTKYVRADLYEELERQLADSERRFALAQQDAVRYQWLCDDLNAEERARRSHILNRMSVMGKGAIDVAIDNIDALPDKEGL